MDSLMIVIDELYCERDRLLDEHGVNLKRLEDIETKISYYEYLFRYYLFESDWCERQIKFLNRWSNRSKLRNYDMFNMLSVNIHEGTSKLSEGFILDLEKKNKGYKFKRKCCVKCLEYYNVCRDDLLERDLEVTKRIEEIDTELAERNLSMAEEKIYKLERGK